MTKVDRLHAATLAGRDKGRIKEAPRRPSLCLLNAGCHNWATVRVLVVEDQEVLADALARGLRLEGMVVDVAYDGRSGLGLAIVNPYEVVVLDRDLPRLHGDDVCRELAASGSARILMLTASGSLHDRVEGLNLGADDYLPKPFAFEELLARVWALARRTGPALPAVMRRGDLALDPARHLATRGGRDLGLSPKQFAVLRLLLAAGGAVVGADTLLERVWGDNIDPGTNTIRVTIATLRRKLGEPPLIETVNGVGYRLP
jgi:DNA-binding response OmpR family regulator